MALLPSACNEWVQGMLDSQGFPASPDPVHFKGKWYRTLPLLPPNGSDGEGPLTWSIAVPVILTVALSGYATAVTLKGSIILKRGLSHAMLVMFG